MSELKLVNPFDEEPEHDVVDLHKPDNLTALPDISDMGVLSETLQLREPTIGDLYEESVSLLNHTGQETTVNDLPALVSHFSYPVKFGKQTLYARLGCKTDTDGNPAGLVSVIFCADDAMENIKTNNGYFSALSFDSTGSHLITGTGENPATDEAQPIALVKSIVTDTKRQFAANRKAALEQQAAEAKQEADAKVRATEEARRAEETRERQRSWRRRQRRRTAGITAAWLAFIGASYSPELYDFAAGRKIDTVTVGGFPVLPYEVEMWNDINNHVDHVAQGFHTPTGALPLKVSASPTTIPLLTGYNTADTPDASFVDQSQDSPVYKGELSKPGLYKSDFNFLSKNKTAAHFDNAGCYEVKGNYVDDKTLVFTQTVDLGKMVTLHVVSTSDLEVCKAPGAPKDSAGAIFLYQK